MPDPSEPGFEAPVEQEASEPSAEATSEEELPPALLEVSAATTAEHGAAQEPTPDQEALAEPSPAAANLTQTGHAATGPGGELWGSKNPSLREKSAATGCTLAATPPKYWPEELATKYFAWDDKQNRTVVGVLRDPYDKIVHEFRLRAEGAGEDESADKTLYESCDVNSWVKQELRSAQKDKFHANCNFLPQAEYFEGPNGINLPIDGRLLPLSFNEVMERHGYPTIHMATTAVSLKCEVSSFSLDAEARAMVKEMYARDLALICKHFGYCNTDEIMCMSHLTGMCGGAPQAVPVPAPEI